MHITFFPLPNGRLSRTICSQAQRFEICQGFGVRERVWTRVSSVGEARVVALWRGLCDDWCLCFLSCSQMSRYSCHWTTPACASLCLLTWACPCVAWRFSTNHSTTSRLSKKKNTTHPPLPLNPNQPNATTLSKTKKYNLYYFLLPQRAPPPTSCVWQVGVHKSSFLCFFLPLRSKTLSSTHPAVACASSSFFLLRPKGCDNSLILPFPFHSLFGHLHVFPFSFFSSPCCSIPFSGQVPRVHGLVADGSTEN